MPRPEWQQERPERTGCYECEAGDNPAHVCDDCRVTLYGEEPRTEVCDA